MRVLVVEDEPDLAGVLERGLGEAGFRVDVVHDGRHAIQRGTETTFDAIVLDVMLPGANGFEVCAELRRRQIWTPVLMLTARDGINDRVQGLDGGADDYVPKPFAFAELTARLRALGRRGPIERPTVLEAGDLRLDPAARIASRGDVALDLSALELALLETLMRHRGQVLDRSQLRAHAWNAFDEGGSNIVDQYIRYLRAKVDEPFGVKSIETVRGLGYRIRRDGGREDSEA
jgi:two-component system, OmpR family, response regulator